MSWLCLLGLMFLPETPLTCLTKRAGLSSSLGDLQINYLPVFVLPLVLSGKYKRCGLSVDVRSISTVAEHPSTDLLK